SIPTMEIDNLEVYLTNKASVESPEAPTVTSVSSVPGTNSVRVSFNKEMGDNIAYYVGLEKENGEKIISTAVTAQDKMSVVVTPAEGQSLADTIVAVVDKYAISADGGIIKSKYEGRVKSPKKYLLYEDFNTMTAGELPGALTLETGTPASIERTTVDEENGDYAIKLTSGSNGYAIGMRLSEAIKGAGSVGALDASDKITIEYDLKNEYGGFGLSWLTSEEIASGRQYILNKNILNLGNPSRKYFGAAQTGTAYWGAPYSPHEGNGRNDENMITGNGEFTSFGEWVHVTMTLDGQIIENNANGTPKYQDRFMNATVSWYEKDTPNVTYTVSKNGNGFQIEGAAGTENHKTQNLGNIRQRDIASVVIPVAASNGAFIPTMEIDNLEVYLTNNTAYAAYAGVDGLTFTINESANLTQAPAGTTAVDVNFDTAMATTAGKYISLISNGVAVPSTGAFSNDGLTYTITPSTPLSADTQYTVIVNKNALTQDGGRLAEEYTNSFVTGAGAFTISDFAITSAGEAINALPTAGTAVNLSLTASNTTSAENVWLIIAEYTDRELTGAKAEQSSIAIGTDTYSLSEDFIVSSGIDTLKAFCWTYDNLIPLTENVQITMPEAE
ncbi:MAG: Ig-like domain-containing protein, partial [Firmicutes bacterium]|nr:Ig-like domain-containing protein [Bacillota bacterium]